MNAKCNTCQIKNIIVKPYLFQSDILIVGESPGREEELQGKPFVGPSGKLLDYGLSSLLKIERKNICITNATLCQIPPQVKQVKSILKKVIAECRDNLVEAISIVKPKYIITLGEIALVQVMNKQMSIGSNRGRVLENSEFNCLVLPTYHPSVILRHGGIQDSNLYWVMWAKDMVNFGQIVRGQKETVITSYQAYNGNAEFSNAKFLAIDAEWNDKGELLVFSISDGKVTRYIWKDDLNPYLKKALGNLFRRPLVFANRPVDERIIEQQILQLPNYPRIDIFNIAKLIDDNLHINLESIAERFTQEGRIKDASREVNKKIWLLEKDKLIAYNCKDAETTAKAFKNLFRELRKDSKLLNYWKNFTIKIEAMLASISKEGFKIDKEKLEINKTLVAEAIAHKEIELISQVNPKILEAHASKGISLTRPDFLIDILFSKQGLRLTPTKVTATGKPSLREDDLVAFSDKKWVADYLQWKKLHKLHNTFLMGLEKNMKEDGFIYPNTVLYATVTGRTACFNPNLQQIPRNMPMVEKLKELFEAPEGWLMGTRDLSQSEIRVMGWLAGDKNILQALKNKVDIHKQTASLVLNKKVDDVTKEERQLCKSINFGFLYGATAKTFMEYAKTNYGISVSIEEAEKLRNKFFEVYNAIPIYHRRCIEITKKYGYIRNVLGRIRRLPHIYSDDYSKVGEAERQAINFPIQSFSSELTLIGMYLFWNEIKNKKSVKLLWTIHDSIFFMCRENLMNEYMNLLKECVEQRAVEYIAKFFGVKVGYPVESDGKIGKNWASLKEV